MLSAVAGHFVAIVAGSLAGVAFYSIETWFSGGYLGLKPWLRWGLSIPLALFRVFLAGVSIYSAFYILPLEAEVGVRAAWIASPVVFCYTVGKAIPKWNAFAPVVAAAIWALASLAEVAGDDSNIGGRAVQIIVLFIFVALWVRSQPKKA